MQHLQKGKTQVKGYSQKQKEVSLNITQTLHEAVNK